MTKGIPSQEDEIFAYMLSHDKINQMIATQEFGCTRLSAIIYNMKKAGIGVCSELVFYTKKNGRLGRYSNYWLMYKNDAPTD